jgi:hypothetical protein
VIVAFGEKVGGRGRCFVGWRWCLLDVGVLRWVVWVQGVNPMMVSAGPSVAASSQAGSNVQSAQAIPQQAVAMHYSQPPSGHFGNFVGYQYVPQNYPYMQGPYPPHMYNSSNSAYGGVPAGSSYPPTGGSSYPSGGATAVKFPMPQYKPLAGAGNVAQSGPGIGYGGYSATPSGYGSNPAVTAGNASGYEDVNTSHYKDNTLYIPSQQVFVKGVWSLMFESECGGWC